MIGQQLIISVPTGLGNYTYELLLKADTDGDKIPNGEYVNIQFDTNIGIYYINDTWSVDTYTTRYVNPLYLMESTTFNTTNLGATLINITPRVQYVGVDTGYRIYVHSYSTLFDYTADSSIPPYNSGNFTMSVPYSDFNVTSMNYETSHTIMSGRVSSIFIDGYLGSFGCDFTGYAETSGILNFPIDIYVLYPTSSWYGAEHFQEFIFNPSIQILPRETNLLISQNFTNVNGWGLEYGNTATFGNYTYQTVLPEFYPTSSFLMSTYPPISNDLHFCYIYKNFANPFGGDYNLTLSTYIFNMHDDAPIITITDENKIVKYMITGEESGAGIDLKLYTFDPDYAIPNNNWINTGLASITDIFTTDNGILEDYRDISLFYYISNNSLSVVFNGTFINNFILPDVGNRAQMIFLGDNASTMGKSRLLLGNFYFNGGEPLPALLNVTINDRTYNSTHTGYEWIFRGDVYKLKAFYQYASSISLNFTDSVNTVFFNYNNVTQKGSLAVLGADGTWKNENVANGLSCNTTVHSNSTLETDWKWSVAGNIVDIFNTTLGYSVSNSIITVTGITGVKFNIYNVGGLAQYQMTGDGYIVAGGSPLQVSVRNSSLGVQSSSSAWLIYRRLQYYHMLAELDTDSKVYGASFAHQEVCGELEFEFDYKLVDKENQAWIEGLRAEITLVPNSMDVGDYGSNADSSVVEYTVDWYNHGVFIRQDKMYSYDYGYSSWVGDAPESVVDHFPTGRRSMPFWVDLWFDNANASKIVGGRVNSQYYGEYESGVSWWFGYNWISTTNKQYNSINGFCRPKRW